MPATNTYRRFRRIPPKTAMEKQKKRTYAKSVDSEKGLVTGYVSTFGWDRDGDRFVKGAWDLESYKKNPVVLWGHNPSIPPIGKAVDIEEDEQGLIAVTEFDRKSELGAQIFGLFERGFLNAFSVGFMRKTFVLEDNGAQGKGIAITGAELFEYSAVSVPANPGALVSREVAEMAMKAIGPKSIERLVTKSAGEQFLVVSGPGEEEEGKPAGEGEPENQPPADLAPALKQVIDLAKAARANKLSEQNKGLLMTAIGVFQETIAENQGDVKADDLIALKSVLTELAAVTAGMYPTLEPQIQKTISHVDKALTGREG